MDQIGFAVPLDGVHPERSRGARDRVRPLPPERRLKSVHHIGFAVGDRSHRKCASKLAACIQSELSLTQPIHPCQGGGMIGYDREDVFPMGSGFFFPMKRVGDPAERCPCVEG